MNKVASTAVFLQVRLHSSRFPFKALEFLGDRTLTQWCFQSLEPLKTDLKVLVTEPLSADSLSPLAQDADWEVFVGSCSNVLDRFFQASQHYSVTTMVRATGDNPFVSARLAGQLLLLHQEVKADYSCFQGGPLGSGVEVFQATALHKAWQEVVDFDEKEHVCPYFYRNPQRFCLHMPKVPLPCYYPQGRISVDTPVDLCYLKTLWNDLGRSNPIDLEEIVLWLKSHPHPGA